MRIGIISDTHTPSTGKEPPPQVAQVFRGVDLILHAGDIYTRSCLDWLERIAPVLAVEHRGPYYQGDPRVAEKQVVELEGFSLGLIHEMALPGLVGEVFPGAIAAGFPLEKSVPEAFHQIFGKTVNIVVFGHTHYALVEEHQGVLVINPGSATLPKHVRKLGTVAILELTGNGPRTQLVNLADIW